MPTQTGSIDFASQGGFKSYASGTYATQSSVTEVSTAIEQLQDNVVISATETDTTAAQGGQHVIQSLINVAPSGVTIDANKVNIEGAALFTSGRLSQTSLDAAYDANGAAAAANSMEQLIYKSAAAGTSSMQGTLTWVNDVTGAQNTWTAKRPQYDSSYPVLFVATQRQTVGGTVTCTTPQIDETTTVIDGGNIITGSVTANELNTANINASNSLTIGAMTTATQASILNSELSGDISDAAKTATNFIRADQTGIRIASTDPSDASTTTYQHQTATETEFVVNSAVRSIISSTGAKYFDGNGVADGNVTASFGTNGAQIGHSSESHLNVTNSGMSLSRPSSNSRFDVGLGPRTAEQNESSAEPITEVPIVHELKWTPQQDSIRVLKDNLDRTFSPPPGERTYAYTLDGKEVTLTDARLVGYRYLIDYTATDFSDVSLTVGSRDSGSIGRASTAFGYMLIAAGEYSHAEGNRSNAEGTSAHAEGLRTKAFDSAHAEGAATTASGYASHAEGVSTIASAYASHAEGNYSEANGLYSHAEGRYTKASGYYAHAQNQGTQALANNQTAIGRYNLTGPEAFIIGNGTDDDNRSNALTVDWDGNVWSDGSIVYLNNGQDETRTYLQAVEETTYNRTRLGTHRSVSGTDVYNNLNLTIDTSGNRSVGVSEVAPWLDMLGLAVSNTTMTVSTTNAGSISNNNVRRSGKVVTVQFTGLTLKSSLSNGTTSATLATIPSGYRPSWNVYFPPAVTSNVGSSYFRIDSSGNLTLRNQSDSAMGTSLNFAATVTYVIA